MRQGLVKGGCERGGGGGVNGGTHTQLKRAEIITFSGCDGKANKGLCAAGLGPRRVHRIVAGFEEIQNQMRTLRVDSALNTYENRIAQAFVQAFLYLLHSP
jgi:hypothetical protein